MPASIAYITGTGTVAVNGTLTGDLKGFIRAGNTTVYSASIQSLTGTSTLILHNAGSGAVATADHLAVATGSSAYRDYGEQGVSFHAGLSAVPSGTGHHVTVVFS